MTYIIAEIGQNHNGSVEMARRIIEVCARPVIDYWDGAELPRVDAVKLTIRDLSAEMRPEEWDAPYDSPHSYGATYGEHRAALELAPDELAECAGCVRDHGLGLVLTVCGPRKVPLAVSLQPDYLKVASRDLTNGPLLRAMANCDIPIILSTGMHGMPAVRWAVAEIERFGGTIGGILHCVSEYPARYEHVDLRALETLRLGFPEYQIGYSDHTIGIVVAAAAVACGARIIEKHVTLSKNLKGSDHAGSMDPEGLWRVVRDIRNVERSMGARTKRSQPATEAARAKLGRSICAARDLAPGDLVQESDLVLLSPGDGLSWLERHRVVGHRVTLPIPAGSRITEAGVAAPNMARILA